MSAHTPGPWEISRGVPSMIRWHEIPVAEIFHIESDIGKANARLVAAAPDMLEVVKACRAFIARHSYAGGPSITPILKAADSAIAKAEGRP